MGAGVVTVGRRVYAVGLYWENSPSGRVTQAAREAALQPGQKAEFYAIRPGNNDGRIPQFGLAQSGVGYKAGMPVFAACLANQPLGSWAGAFRLQQGTVVVVVRDDLIVPDGDNLYTNESEARDRLLQEIGFGGLLRVYAPEAWGISGTDNVPISLLLNDRHDIRLKSAEIPKKMLIFIGVGVGILVLALGGGWYYQVRKEEDERQMLAQQQALERARHAASNLLPSGMIGETPNYPPPERKWEKRPEPLSVLEACRAGLPQISAAIAGWKLATLKCDGSTISVSWSHENEFSVAPAHAQVEDKSLTALRSIALPTLNPRGQENLFDPSEVVKRRLAQNWQGSIQPVPDDPPPPPPPGYKGTWNPPPPPWVKRSFTFTVQDLPGILPVYFSGIPGIVINSLSYTVTGSTSSWTVEGVIYENRI
jgi:hypothetical protein